MDLDLFKPDCPFCKIIHDRLEYYGVHETDMAMAFLDLNPVSDGHTLVIPKVHAEELTDLDDNVLDGLFRCVKNTAQAIKTSLNPAGINILQSNGKAAGQEILHTHVHIIPRYGNDKIQISFNGDQLDTKKAQQLLEQIKHTTT